MALADMLYVGPYAPGAIKPIVRVGEKLLLVQQSAYDLYQVAFVEPLPLSPTMLFNGGAVAATTTTAVQNPQNILNMQYGQLSQLRMRVLDDINVTVFQPQANARHATMGIIATVNPFTTLAFPNDEPTEVFVLEQQPIFFTIQNPRATALVQSRIAFYGLRYVLLGLNGRGSSGNKLPPIRTFSTIDDAINSGERFTVVPVGGWVR